MARATGWGLFMSSAAIRNIVQQDLSAKIWVRSYYNLHLLLHHYLIPNDGDLQKTPVIPVIQVLSGFPRKQLLVSWMSPLDSLFSQWETIGALLVQCWAGSWPMLSDCNHSYIPSYTVLLSLWSPRNALASSPFSGIFTIVFFLWVDPNWSSYEGDWSQKWLSPSW